MQSTRNSCSHVHVFSNTLDFCSIDEVAWANCLSHNIIVIITSSHFKAKLFCYIHQLRAYFSYFSQRFELEIVRWAPLRTKVVFFPLLVDVKICKMVAFRDQKLLADGFGFLLMLFRFVEDRRNRKHWNYGNHFIKAT